MAMDMKMKVVTVIAVVSTVVAVVEGVMLVRSRGPESAAVVAQTPAADGAVSRDAGTQPAGRGPGESATETAALPESKNGAARDATPVDTASTGTPADASAGTPVTPEAPAAAGPELSAEEKAEKERAEAMAKMKEAMVTMAEQGLKQMMDRLKLTDVQRQAAAATVEKIRQALLNTMLGPAQMGKEMEQRVKDIRQEALARGQTEAEIAELMKSEQARMMTQIQEHVTSGLTEMSTSMEELRPILDVQQTATLDQMKKELAEQQAMMNRVMEAVKAPPPPPTPAPPAP